MRLWWPIRKCPDAARPAHGLDLRTLGLDPGIHGIHLLQPKLRLSTATGRSRDPRHTPHGEGRAATYHRRGVLVEAHLKSEW